MTAFEITIQRWEEGRVIIRHLRPMYETEGEAIEALRNIKRNPKLIYNVRKILHAD